MNKDMTDAVTATQDALDAALAARDLAGVQRHGEMLMVLGVATSDDVADLLAVTEQRITDTPQEPNVYEADGIFYCADCGREVDFCNRAGECRVACELEAANADLARELAQALTARDFGLGDFIQTTTVAHAARVAARRAFAVIGRE